MIVRVTGSAQGATVRNMSRSVCVPLWALVALGSFPVAYVAATVVLGRELRRLA